MLSGIRRLLLLIGPYPYNPYLIFLFVSGTFTLYFFGEALNIDSQSKRLITILIIIITTSIVGGYFALTAYIFNNYRRWNAQSLFLYILEIILAKLVFTFFGKALSSCIFKATGVELIYPGSRNLRAFIGSTVVIIISLALMNKSEKKIVDRLQIANRLVEQLQSDREELVNLDEAIRRQTSRILHDQVQSDLMVVGMNLRSILGKSSGEIDSVIDNAISQLEKSRSKDLRELIQTLSPNIEAGGLKGSLETLIIQYQNNMSLSLQVDSNSEKLDRPYLLGVYRIIQQALLNSFVHGPAKNVLVTVATNSDKTEIAISDDGPGTDLLKVQSGVGSAIIDSWVGILKGKKTVDTVPGHGYRLVVNFPA